SPASVGTGLELRIPLAALGTTANGGGIKVSVFGNGASHDYVSNQALGSFPYGTGNLGDGTGGYSGGTTPVSRVDFTAYAGNQYVTVANGGLATASARAGAQVSIAPNPAQARFMVQLPAVTSAEATRLTLYNSLGQVVRQLSAPASASSSSVAVEAAGLAGGVYVLRVQAGTEVLATQRVVLE
ncbi:MAG: T9SS type A sorting domain-containing protein, partial [Bacteroidota bacterium]|nr:T9SS type A sorting domain-containing protein [Bacteroidota bacterium]